MPPSPPFPVDSETEPESPIAGSDFSDLEHRVGLRVQVESSFVEELELPELRRPPMHGFSPSAYAAPTQPRLGDQVAVGQGSTREVISLVQENADQRFSLTSVPLEPSRETTQLAPPSPARHLLHTSTSKARRARLRAQKVAREIMVLHRMIRRLRQQHTRLIRESLEYRWDNA